MELLRDVILATAPLDRLTHKCQVLDFADESWRLAQRKHIFKQKSWGKLFAKTGPILLDSNIPCVDFILRGIAYFLRKFKQEKEDS